MEEPIDFIAEAKAALSDVSFALQYGELSNTLPSDCTVAYINLTTRENDHFCVKLNSCGFQVVGNAHNKTDGACSSESVFETVYAMMEHISPSYTNQFASQLAGKLESLPSEQ